MRMTVSVRNVRFLLCLLWFQKIQESSQRHDELEGSNVAVTNPKKPNFVIFLADDIGYGDLGANMSPGASDTPYMDVLAAQGTRLTDFHAGASVCSPSRASLLTARLGKRTGVVKNFDPGSKGGLPLNETTFAETLKASGYRTGMIGKWHLGHYGPFHPIKRGFDYYFGLIESNDMGCVDNPGYDIPTCPACWTGNLGKVCVNQIAVPLYENTTIIEQPANLETLSSRYAQRAVNFIHESVKAATPFVLYVAFAHTHVPLQYDTRFANLSTRGPFGDTLRELDSTVNDIMTGIRGAGIEEDTMVWFTGDNGAWAQKCQYAGSSGPFMGYWQTLKGGGGSTAKQTVWEGGHREPSFVYWPGHIPAGRVLDSLLSAMDIYPTIASIAGVAMPGARSYDGIDISSVLLHGGSLSLYNNRTLFHPTNARVSGDIDAIRYGQFKAIYHTGGSEECGGKVGPSRSHSPPLIFDLRNDPQESSPLDPATPEYKSALSRIEKMRSAFYMDVSADNTTVVDYGTGAAYYPCCNWNHMKCCCRKTCK